MKEKMVGMRFLVEGMTCVSCENRIEKTLKGMDGVAAVSANYATSEVDVSFQADLLSVEAIENVLKGIDYPVLERCAINDTSNNSRSSESKGQRHAASPAEPAGKAGQPKKRTGLLLALGKLAGLLIALFALAMIINQTGGFNLFNAFPQAEAGMGLGMLFIIGLLTSVHCVAMCGGINLTQCASFPAAPGSPSGSGNPSGSGSRARRWQTVVRPGFLYHSGRVVSYTVIGGLVGAMGSVISFSGTAKGIVQLAAGLFMVIMGLNMLNLFPWLRRFNPHLPKIFARKINDGKTNSRSPFFVGLLNGLMPCGPLQAMQLYALSTGSPVKGALAMLLFSLGTVPLMFGLSIVSTWLTGRSRGMLLKASAVLVSILGIFMFSSGLSLAGIAMPELPVRANGAAVTAGANVAVIKDGVQTVTIQLNSGRYEPITVQKGVPVKWNVQAAAGTINGCNNEIVVPKYNVSKKLQVGDNIIEFTPTATGVIAYSCWMGMIRSKITVVDDLSNLSSAGAVSGSYKIATATIAVATVKDGKQQIRVAMDARGLSPAIIVLQRGLPAVWTIGASEVGTSNSFLFFPTYNAQLDMIKGDNPIQLTPENDFAGYAADNSFFVYVKVVDDLADFDDKAIRQEVAAFVPQYPEAVDESGLPNCCAP